MTDDRRLLEREEAPPSSPDGSALDVPRSLLAGVMEIQDVTTGALQGRAVRVRGRFLIDPSEAYRRLAPWFRERGRTVMFRREDGADVILIVPGVIRPSPNKLWTPIVLAVVTVVSMLAAYVLFQSGAELTREGILGAVAEGWGFVASLLAILVCHEFGHYLMARHFGVAVTLPYLIPLPISPFGTMGAVIRMKDIPPNRRAMLLIGAAGPLAGLVVAIPVLLYGLSLSGVTALPASGYSMEGNSLLYAGLKYLVFGRYLPSGGEDVFLHPVAFAGWAGLLVTSFNLIPAGQLDGGHIAYALLGHRTRILNWAMIGALLLMGLLWQGWFLWAFLVFIFSRARVRPMDDVSPLTPVGIVVAVSLLVLFVLTFTPVPLRIIM
jgi:Zn-dependent protease